jgi:Putative Flp pilus-assembly TadE/G-like
MTHNNQPNRKVVSPTRRVPLHERGQILPIAAVMMITLLGLCGFVVDVGRLYISYQQLQASTDAAALAGGEALGQAGQNPVTVAASYGSTSGNKNAFGNLSGATITATPKCYSSLGLPCYSYGSYNAIQVTQTVSVPVTFAKFFGGNSTSLTAVATAAASGAATTPYNVAIILDTTVSMGDSDNGSTCSGTRLSCALGGIQTLMKELYPCASQLSSCTVTSGVAANAVDQVALFTFPNVTTSTVSDDYTCPNGRSTNPTTNDAYTFPTATLNTTTGLQNLTFTPTHGTASTMTYQITNGLGSNGYMSDYRTSDTSSGLNASSDEAIAIGAGACKGLSNPGGAGTYYAGVIYAAANSLLYEQAQLSYPTQNVIILISDGDATSSQAEMVGGTGAPGTQTGGAGNATSLGTYPSWKNECAQAVTAAAAAAAKGIRVYAVAYGAESSGCSTDSPSITPCQTMKSIASSPAYFYSDYAQTGSGVDTSCAGSGASTTSINQIFQDIATSFTVARLVPNNLT